MKVSIFYSNITTGNHEHIADIEVHDTVEIEDALEEAFFFFQNLEGSWSVGPTYEDGTPNRDYRPGVVTLIKELVKFGLAGFASRQHWIRHVIHFRSGAQRR